MAMLADQNPTVMEQKHTSNGTIYKVSGDGFERRNALYDLTILPLTRKMAEWSKSEARQYLIDNLRLDPQSNSLLFDRKSSGGRLLKEKSAQWQALHYLYNFNDGRTKDLLDWFWAKNLLNAKAVRNRLKVVRALLKNEIKRQKKVNDDCVRILYLACGSAESLLAVLSELENASIEVMLVDQNQGALEKAEQIAKRYNIRNKVQLREANVFRRTKQFTQEFQPHMVQMIGLLDYLSDEQAVRIIEWVESEMLEYGAFMTCNIFPNPERPFVRVVTDWEMNYREPDDLVRIPAQAGFDHTEVFVEPQGIHGVSLSRNSLSQK